MKLILTVILTLVGIDGAMNGFSESRYLSEIVLIGLIQTGESAARAILPL